MICPQIDSRVDVVQLWLLEGWKLGERPERIHPGGNSGPNRKSISHRYYPILVAFARELIQETTNLPLGCLQGGVGRGGGAGSACCHGAGTLSVRVVFNRGTSLIRDSPPPQDHHMTLAIVLL